MATGSIVAMDQQNDARCCSMCLGNMPDEHAPDAWQGISQLPCNHRFHTTCINPWFDYLADAPKTCPDCRAVVDLSRVRTGPVQNQPHGHAAPNHVAAGPVHQLVDNHDAAPVPVPEVHLGWCERCFHDFRAGDNIQTLPCDHRFHRRCVDDYVRMHGHHCPLCYAAFGQPQPAYDYLHHHAEHPQLPRCSICRNELDEHDYAQPIRRLRCGHRFHERCIADRAAYNNHCPLCERPIEPNNRVGEDQRALSPLFAVIAAAIDALDIKYGNSGPRALTTSTAYHVMRLFSSALLTTTDRAYGDARTRFWTQAYGLAVRLPLLIMRIKQATGLPRMRAGQVLGCLVAGCFLGGASSVSNHLLRQVACSAPTVSSGLGVWLLPALNAAGYMAMSKKQARLAAARAAATAPAPIMPQPGVPAVAVNAPVQRAWWFV